MSARETPAPLPLPSARCLTKQQAAEYLGIGVTLLTQVGPKPIKFGRRTVYDVVDLDSWLDEYKQRGRVIKEARWLEKKDSTGEKAPPSGGSMRSSQTDAEYAKALSLDC